MTRLVVLLWIGIALGSAGSFAGLPGREKAPVGIMLALGLVGSVLLVKRPGHRIGWLMSGTAAVMAFGGILYGFGALADRWSWPGRDVAYWAADLTWIPLIASVVLLIALFPTGRLLSRRWRWLYGALVGFVVFAFLANAFQREFARFSHPFPIEGAEAWFELFLAIAVVLLVSAFAGAITALVLRFRRGSAVERLQLKWFLAAAALVPFLITLGEETGLQAVGVSAATIGLVGSVGVAVLRYRLYEIDQVINRTVVYAIVVGLLAAVYVGAVFLLGGVLPGQSSDLAVAGSTLAVAALFNPLRRRVQRFVDHRFYRSRYDAQQLVEALSARLRDEVELEAVTDDWVRVVREAVQPKTVSVWIRSDSS